MAFESLTVQEKRLFIIAFALLSAASVLPVWIVRYHPLADLPNHLAATSIWYNYKNPVYQFSQYYYLDLGANPYWGYYALMLGLIPLAGLDIANRLVLCLYILGLPLGITWLSVRFGRSPWLGLFAFPFIWTFCWIVGFIHTSLGFALVIWALAAFDSFCERPRPMRAALAALLGASIYFFHVVPWGLYWSCAGLIGLLHEQRSWRRLAGRFGVWAAAVVPGVVVTLTGRGKGMGQGLRRYSFSWDRNYGNLLRQLYDWTWNNCTGHEDELLAGVLLAAWLLLRITAKGGRLRLHDLRALACFVTALCAYLLLPKSMVTPAYSWGIKYRYAAMALLFMGLCIPGVIAGWRRLLLVPVALVGLGFAADTTVHWVRANQYTAGFEHIPEVVPQGARVLFVVRPPWGDPGVKQFYAPAWPSYYQAFHGGYNPWLFDDFPVRFRKHLPAPNLRQMDFSWDQFAPQYDFFVIFHDQDGDLFATHKEQVRSLGKFGEWTVWQPIRDEP